MNGVPILPGESVHADGRDATPPPPEEMSESTVDALYLEYAPFLRRYAMRRFGVPREDVDSLVHDVFATYLTDPTSIRSIRPYLVGGICNASRQYWRRRDREVVAFAEPADEPVDEQTLDRIAMRLDLGIALSRIGRRCREALRRYYLDGESTVVIAEKMATTPANVNYLVHVCRKRARAVLEGLRRCI